MRRLPLLALLVLLAVFVAAVAHLFRLRFELGDVYPPYSSLRADPLGSKAFYQSLERLLPAGRNRRATLRLPHPSSTTLYYLGADTSALDWTDRQFEQFDQLVKAGGRAVFALYPAGPTNGDTRFAPPVPTRPPSGKQGTPVPPHEELRVSLLSRWGIPLKFVNLERGTNRSGPSAPIDRRSMNEALPARLAVHSSHGFQPEAPGWEVIYERPLVGMNPLPVVLERRLGLGTVVVCADSFYFSNEALRSDRQAAFLSWTLGPAGEVVFDEAHLGVNAEPGVMALARKYHLQPLGVALLVLALLFVWRNVASLVPAHAAGVRPAGDEAVAGQAAAAGFENLLRRNLPAGDLAKLCLELWQADVAPVRRVPRQTLEALQRLIDEANQLPAHQRKPVELYRKFCAVLQRKP